MAAKSSSFRTVWFLVDVVTIFLLAVVIIDFLYYAFSELIFTRIARPDIQYPFWMPPRIGIGALGALVVCRVFAWFVLGLMERSVEARRAAAPLEPVVEPAALVLARARQLAGGSKRRVWTVLAGGIPDRVPIGEFAIDFDTVERVIGHDTYLRAKAKSRVAFWEGRHEEVAESYLKDHIELHRSLGVLDIVTFPEATWEIPPPTDDPPPRKVDHNTWEDKYGRVYRYSEATADITCIKDPVAEARRFSVDEFERAPDAPQRDERSWRIIDGVIKEFREEKFICGLSGGEIGITLLGGMERGLPLVLTRPDIVRAATQFALATQNLADALWVHPDQDGVLWGADFGHKTGPFVSPALFRQLFLEANKARVRALHTRGQKVLKHCCGNLWELLDLFLEMGYDCYQSIQGTAGMDICEVKKRYGDKITLWGGVALENLQSGTAEDVRQDVRRAMECAKRGARFILGSSHSIAVGTKYDNYMAMLDEYYKLASY